MLCTIGCCLARGKFKPRSEVNIFKVEFWPVMFVHFRGVQLAWTSGEWYNCKRACTNVVYMFTVRTVNLLSISVFDSYQRKMPPWSLILNVTYWRMHFRIFIDREEFYGSVCSSLWSFKLLSMNQTSKPIKIWVLLCQHMFETIKDETMRELVLFPWFLKQIHLQQQHELNIAVWLQKNISSCICWPQWVVS